MPWGWAIDWRLASVVDTTWPLLSARLTIWLLLLTWLTGIVSIVCVAIPERIRDSLETSWEPKSPRE